MNRRILILLFGSVLIVSTLSIIIVIDNKLFYYGKSNYGFHEKLPFQVTPEYRGIGKGDSGFGLWDDFEMSLIVRGVKYWSSHVQVDSVIGYGFNNDQIVALVSDSLKDEYYVMITQTPEGYSLQPLTVKVIPRDSLSIPETIRWIDIGNTSTEEIETARYFLSVFLVLLTFITLYFLPKKLYKRTSWTG